MAEIKLQRIRGAYGEISGILSQIPLAKDAHVLYRQSGEQYNMAVDELSSVSETDYSRYKLGVADQYSPSAYLANVSRTKIGGLVKRLEEEYGFGASSAVSHTAPVIVTVNQNQQLTVSVTPIQQIIDTAVSEELRQELEELKRSLNRVTVRRKRVAY